MRDSIYRFSLDIHSTQSQVSISVPQFDTARSFYATLTESGKPYQISPECRAVFCATKADGTKLFNDCIIISNSIVRYDFTEQTTTSVGIVDCSIKIYGSNNKVLTSPRLTIVVYEGTGDEAWISDNESSVIGGIVQAEVGRVDAEVLRVEAEKERVEAENLRDQAETERVEAENARKTALKVARTCSDANEAVETGVYSCNNAANTPIKFGTLVVYTKNAETVVQEFYAQATDTYQAKLTARRDKIWGSWGEWEWENPYMGVGAEYRTTEKWQGKPVYTKLINLGKLPNNTSAYFYNTVPTNARVLSFDGFCSDNGGESALMKHISKIWHTKNQNYIGLSTNSDQSAYTEAYVTIKYIKE
jgi:hypothetical protein